MTSRIIKLTMTIAALIAWTTNSQAEIVDFEEFATNATVNTISTGVGDIVVLGTDPRDPSTNYARVFDSANPTCFDADLGTPNAAFGGPGMPENEATNNDIPLGKILIIQDSISPCAPDDIDLSRLDGATIQFDFTDIGLVTIDTISFIDIDGNGPDPRVELFDALDNTIAVLSIPQTIENGVVTVDISAEGVASMTVFLQGSAGLTGFEFHPPAPPIAALGDRVWEDGNGDGVQNCRDRNGDGILGNRGDIGPECRAGIPDIPVVLLLPGVDGVCNSGDETVLQLTNTDADGFYLFENLDPDPTYCVGFGRPSDDFCVVDGIALGSPLFTKNNVFGDKKDSDADPATGQTGNIDLAPGQTDRTWDAGIVCPVKIGDRVWEDDGDGIQEAGEPNIGAVDVELWSCGPDMIAGTGDDVFTGETRTTDSDGMYMFGGEPDFQLPPGKYFVVFDPNTYPTGYSASPVGVGPDNLDSDCAPPRGLTACTDLRPSGTINLDRDCGLVPPAPNCDLVLDKACRVDPPPPPDFDKCTGKLQQFSLIWTGASPITATGPNNSVTLNTNDEATFFGPFSSNDVVVNISGAVDGQSEFHVSCSDEDFNDPSDCGKFAGDGRSNDSGLINDWLLDGFIDAEGRVLDCTPAPEGEFADNCSFVQPPAPSCETTGKPENLTWRYDGGSGSCEDSTFNVQKDFMCTGSVDTSAQVTVTPDQGGSFLVNPGEEFTIPLDASKLIMLSNGGGTQELVLHVSCSQPIEAGLTAGALTLVSLDGQTGGVGVTYQYTVTNNGDPLTGVSVIDDLLGDIGGPIALGSGDSAVFSKSTTLMGTTVNIGTASGELADGQVCSPDSASDTVTVEAIQPTCEVSIQLDRIEDNKIKWKLSNASGVDATIDTMTIAWPGSEDLGKVKFDGNEILKDDLRSSPATITSGEWLKDVEDRTLGAGESGKTLEAEFTGDFPLKDNQPAGDFDLDLSFEQGCSVTF